MTPVFERAKTVHLFDRVATVIGLIDIELNKINESLYVYSLGHLIFNHQKSIALHMKSHEDLKLLFERISYARVFKM
jgi:hypothetical protein